MLPLIILVVTLSFSFDAVTGETIDDKTQFQGATLGCEVLKQRLDELQTTLSKLFTFTEQAEQARQESQRVIMETLQEEIVEKIARLHTKRGNPDCEESEISVKYALQQPINSTAIPMVCDAEAFGGGWFVIQQRIHGGLSFHRDWQQYRNGFGSVGKVNEFWIGLERMHRLTKNEPCELVVELRDESGRYGYARYSGFKVAGENDNYRLSEDLSFIEGSIVDKMIGSRNEQFSTHDMDNDRSEESCGFKFESGWWFNDCKSLNPNGPYRRDPETGRGIFWDGWTNAATYSRMMIRRIRQTVQPDVKPFIEDCKDVQKSGTNFLRPPGISVIFPVFCEAESFGGGWLVVQQRIDGTVDFNRNWNDYKHGFGTIRKSTEFWLGLEQMHQITKNKPYDMLIELKNDSGQYGYGIFSNFKVANESDGYRLFQEFMFSEGIIRTGLQMSRGAKFSTYDNDNDRLEENCGSLYKSGWWFYKCRHSNLNGPYMQDPETLRGIFWHGWAKASTYSRMMIRST